MGREYLLKKKMSDEGKCKYGKENDFFHFKLKSDLFLKKMILD